MGSLIFLWVFDYISTIHFMLASAGAAVVCCFKLYCAAFSYVKSVAASEAQASMKVSKQSQRGEKDQGKKKSNVQATAANGEAESNAGNITFMTWVGPMLLLVAFKDSMSDLQLVLSVCGLVTTLKVGSMLVKRLERSEWRQKLRAGAQKEKSRAEKE